MEDIYEFEDYEHEDAEPTEPEEGDYVITYASRIGSGYSTIVAIHGERRTLGIAPDEDVDVAIREDMIEHEFFPNVWQLSDHGNYHLTSVTGER